MVSAPRAAVRAQEVAGMCRPWLVQDLCSDLLSRWVMGAIRPQPRGSAVEACAPGCPSSFLVLYQRAGLMVPSFPITFLTQEYCSWKMSQGPLPTTPPSIEGPWRGGKAHLQGHTRGQELNPNSILPAAMDLCTTLPLPPPAPTSPALGSSRGWPSAQLLWQLITCCDSLRELSRTLYWHCGLLLNLSALWSVQRLQGSSLSSLQVLRHLLSAQQTTGASWLRAWHAVGAHGCSWNGTTVSSSCKCWSMAPGEEMSAGGRGRQEQLRPRQAACSAASSWDAGPLVPYV